METEVQTPGYYTINSEAQATASQRNSEAQTFIKAYDNGVQTYENDFEP